MTEILNNESLIQLILMQTIFTDCGQTFLFKTGVISSPNFPGEPPIMLRQCLNTIKAQYGQRIQLEFLEVTDMTYYFCYGSRLSVFEGSVEAASFCQGLKDLHSTFLSSGTELRLVYTRNILWPTSFKFRLRYTIIEGKFETFYE